MVRAGAGALRGGEKTGRVSRIDVKCKAANTPAEGSVLELSVAPLVGRCSACGWRGDIVGFACGACGSIDVELEGGDSFRLDAFEVEERDREP